MLRFLSSTLYKQTCYALLNIISPILLGIKEVKPKMWEIFKKKEGQVFNNLQGLFIGLAVVMIVAVVAFLIAANVGANAQVAADPNATAAVNTITDAMDDIPDWIPLIVLVLIGALILLAIRVFGR